MGKRIYLNRTDEPAPAWIEEAERALKEAREAADRARSALVQALIEQGVDRAPEAANALAGRIDRLAAALEGGAAYGPFASLIKTEWTGGDSHDPKNHRRYLEVLP